MFIHNWDTLEPVFSGHPVWAVSCQGLEFLSPQILQFSPLINGHLYQVVAVNLYLVTMACFYCFPPVLNGQWKQDHSNKTRNNGIQRRCLSFFAIPLICGTCTKRSPAIFRGLHAGSTVLRAPWLVKNLSFIVSVNPFEKFDLQTSLPPPTSPRELLSQ